jgi:hypothetical protein
MMMVMIMTFVVVIVVQDALPEAASDPMRSLPPRQAGFLRGFSHFDSTTLRSTRTSTSRPSGMPASHEDIAKADEKGWNSISDRCCNNAASCRR